MNSYIAKVREQELLDCFERRFSEVLKDARENCDHVSIFPQIHESKRGVLTATVSFSWSRDGKSGSVDALYEYRSDAQGNLHPGWYCTHDWND